MNWTRNPESQWLNYDYSGHTFYVGRMGPGIGVKACFVTHLLFLVIIRSLTTTILSYSVYSDSCTGPSRFKGQCLYKKCLRDEVYNGAITFGMYNLPCL